MALYSVWDWTKGLYRVYRSGKGGGMYEPSVREPGGDKRMGVMVEDVLAKVPFGARMVGLSPQPLGQLATDGQQQRQVSRADRPVGLGALGQLDVPEPSPISATLRWGPLVLVGITGLILWDFWRYQGRTARANSRPRRRRRRLR